MIKSNHCPERGLIAPTVSIGRLGATMIPRFKADQEQHKWLDALL